MSAILKLQEYADSSSDDDNAPYPIERLSMHLQPPPPTPSTTTAAATSSSTAIVSAAPAVPRPASMSDIAVDPHAREIRCNLTVDRMYAPVAGPENPEKLSTRSVKNTLAGFVESTHMSDFHFEDQRRSFDHVGTAADPSQARSLGDTVKKSGSDLVPATVDPNEPATKKKRRARDKNTDSGDVDEYKGPWAAYADEVAVARPASDDAEFCREYMKKMSKRRKRFFQEYKDEPETSTMHLKEEVDYAGRSWFEAPTNVGVNLRSEEPPDRCYLPKKLIHTWQGHTKGVSTIRWFPKTAHLLLSSGMDNQVKLWNVYGERHLIRTYGGHRQSVKDVCFNNDGSRFLSSSYDRYTKLWDTETGECLSRFQTVQRKMMNCVVFNPDADKQDLFLVGTADKKILCFDIRQADAAVDPSSGAGTGSSAIVQEYDRHLGAVNSITFIEQNRRFVSTSDDKSIRLWEWDVPVDFKLIADPGMHSMPAVTKAPNDRWLLMQSMENRLIVFQCHANRYRIFPKKKFSGHMVAGYACKPSFSPEMSYVVSGDADGRVFVWDWRTSRILSKWKAHDRCAIHVLWHPHETSKIASAGWDGSIKLWD